jgi:LPXTG-motif cell wall-anchored protein
MWVCQASLAFTGGEGAVEKDTATVALPRTGGPVEALAVTGLLLVVSGAGTVVLARRRTG